MTADEWIEVIIRACLACDALLGLLLAAFAPRLRPGAPDQVTRMVRLTALVAALWAACLALAWPPSLPIFHLAASVTGVVAIGLVFALIRLLLRLPPVLTAEESVRDLLTGVLSRSGLLQAYRQLPAGTPVSVALIDVNGLKLMNDVQGHNTGDLFLHGIAQALTAASPAGSLIGRWGGDEFVTLTPSTSPEIVMDTLKLALRATPGARPGLPAFAFGVAGTHTPEPLERPIAVADERMYTFKQRQREIQVLHGGGKGPDSLEEYARQLDLLTTPEELLPLGLSLSLRLVGFEAAAYYGRVNGSFRLLNFSGDERLRDLHGQWSAHLDTGQGPVGEAVITRRTTWSADYQNDTRGLPECKVAGLRSVLATPVYDASRLTGILCLTSFEAWHAVTPQRRYLLERLAQHIGYALEGMQMHEEEKQQLEEGNQT
ncbi:diguanylate cyclase domain-containing protein [Deinococcus sp. QL22]|uniref:diguanylate cyclase domain-containing protein n=1 Tax=Deinococcus sp. QL22 TaxID=2939437 RepID=UPI002017D131|nr:diguanylate cyclase [Deinococcus sp. QL22]UQN09976.1 diguanylate cyclase [Deinococcus sp. QL22]